MIPLLSRRQAAEILGVQPQTLAVWATTGRYELPFTKVGRLVKYDPADLEKFVRSRTVTNTGQAQAL
ncbi:MAG TPA: helix-turn-helix domain-containing protein [Pirellulaceae bacterium]|nr:helix-turn-helix domain-containing protein [Pirellulaceae bacterium]